MRIDDRHIPAGQQANAEKTSGLQEIERAGVSRAQGSGKRAAADRVELSGLAGRISQALDASAAQRAERVEQVSREYAAGHYQVDAAAVSRAMVKEMQAAGHEGASGRAEPAG